jgi:hypothetical protein
VWKFLLRTLFYPAEDAEGKEGHRSAPRPVLHKQALCGKLLFMASPAPQMLTVFNSKDTFLFLQDNCVSPVVNLLFSMLFEQSFVLMP